MSKYTLFLTHCTLKYALLVRPAATIFRRVVTWMCDVYICVYYKYASLGGSGGMLPQKKFEIRCSEIASEAIFWQTVATLHTEYCIWQF